MLPAAVVRLVCDRLTFQSFTYIMEKRFRGLMRHLLKAHPSFLQMPEAINLEFL